MDNLNTLLLSASHRGKKIISGIYNYNILTNPTYSDSFFYTSIEKRNFDFLKTNSELVERILLLGEPRLDGTSEEQHVKDLIYLLVDVGSHELDMLDGINQDKGDGGILQALQDDLQIEIDIEGD